LAIGKNLNKLVAWQLVGDGREIERVSAGRIVARKGERTDGVKRLLPEPSALLGKIVIVIGMSRS
jgi:hypothetical protein